MPNTEFKKSSKLEFLSACLPACLITFERLEAKLGCNTWSPNFATIIY